MLQYILGRTLRSALEEAGADDGDGTIELSARFAGPVLGHDVRAIKDLLCTSDGARTDTGDLRSGWFGCSQSAGVLSVVADSLDSF